MNSNFTEVCIKGILNLKNVITMGAFFWDYSGYYYYSGLGITQYKEFQFRKER